MPKTRSNRGKGGRPRLMKKSISHNFGLDEAPSLELIRMANKRVVPVAHLLRLAVIQFLEREREEPKP